MNTRSTRKMSSKGQEHYESQVSDYCRRLSSIRTIIEELFTELTVEGTSFSEMEQDIQKYFAKFLRLSNEFRAFLERCKTEESFAELSSHVLIFETLNSKVNSAIEHIHQIELAGAECCDKPIDKCKDEKLSEKKGEKKSSKPKTSASSFLRKTKAKAEAARARLKFAEEEADLKRKQAENDVCLDILAHKKALAEAEAELHVAEESVSESNPSLSLPVSDQEERTRRYVQQHRDFVHPPYEEEENLYPASVLQFVPMKPEVNTQATRLNPEASDFVPNSQVRQIASEFTRFLLKKELLFLKLAVFKDEPSCYHSWKVSFKSVISELQATPAEELDMLVTWLGPESSKHAVSVRNSCCGNPVEGLDRLWGRLDERFGSPAMVESTVRYKLLRFGKVGVKDAKSLFELTDILCEIEALKEDVKYRSVLTHFDSSTGVNPIIQKLPISLQHKWMEKAFNYKRQYGVSFPPFTFLVQFIRDVSSAWNDPSFSYDRVDLGMSAHQSYPTAHNKLYPKPFVTARKTSFDRHDPSSQALSSDASAKHIPYCPLHKTHHSANKCRALRQLSISERKEIIGRSGFCFRCCESTKHMAKDCKAFIKCLDCGNNKHCTVMHIDQRSFDVPGMSSYGGENRALVDVTSKCSQVCSPGFIGKSCAKTVLVKVYPKDEPDKVINVYAIIDDQSNKTLAKSRLLDLFNISGDAYVSFSLSSCNGVTETTGRQVRGLVVEAVDGRARFEFPGIVECDHIPDVSDEIPTPEVVLHHPHLRHLAGCIPPLDASAEILLLIGRDVPDVHHVLEQYVGPKGSPFAQRLPLGWVVVGDVCLGKVHAPRVVNVNKTAVLSNGRPTLLQPCPNDITLQEITSVDDICHENGSHDIGASVFQRTKDDERIGQSVEDRQFFDLMKKEFVKDKSGHWTCPLPFKPKRQRLPNNRTYALNRAKMLDRNLRRNPQKKEHFVNFMRDLFEMRHAELAPAISESEECWYLPLFGVYHPKKPDQLRGVFDSSAVFQNVSLNTVLMTGPDLTNNLVSVLLNFRKAPIAITADIQKMFYCFYVKEQHRNYLRFFWYEGNNPDNGLIEHRMCVHVFGNSPSPSVAAYGLRKTVENSEIAYGEDVKKFVENNFCVDDALASVDTEQEAVSLMKRTQEALKTEGHLRLHKIASNSKAVMTAFSPEDLAKDLNTLDVGTEMLPMQRSLGLAWNLNTDSFTFTLQMTQLDKPFTRRGLLSTINSLFDPLGFLAPIAIQGKILLRELVSKGVDWDEELPAKKQDEWNSWKRCLKDVEKVFVPRTFLPLSVNRTVSREIHIYSDASEKAKASVAYLRAVDKVGEIHVGFIFGKAKVAPSHATTIPRLELCAAVLAVDIAEFLRVNLDFSVDDVIFFTDSKVVLGYIRNDTRRFYTYVSNRVEKIRRNSNPDQWNYVQTDLNPADTATRYVQDTDMQSKWLKGPRHLVKRFLSTLEQEQYPLVGPDVDKEVRPEVRVNKTEVSHSSCLAKRFEKFSSWKKLLSVLSLLKTFLRRSSKAYNPPFDKISSVKMLHESETLILKELQIDAYSTEITCVKESKALPKQSSIVHLNPFLDSDGLLRVGGRLSRSNLSSKEKHPYIVPGKSHIARLLVLHYHEEIKHQGRQITEGDIRSAGFWITGLKRLVSSMIHRCVVCRRLRRPLENQKMADLPSDRLTAGPPFTSVGLDTFGPWSVVTRRTRGGQANSKRWAILFTCLTTRAIHIEVVEELSSSTFINALKRFTAVRGKVTLFRSDRGTNFVGATDDLKIDTINVEDRAVKQYLHNSGCVWIFNPPHSSHMGGVWERMIELVRRILDSILMSVSSKHLTHEVLTTFLAEASAIINSRPIVPVYSDPDCPEILSPAMLLTQKSDLITSPPGNLTVPDMYRHQWKRVQLFANLFWTRWKREYLQLLQSRRKWVNTKQNLKQGDIVLLRDKAEHRNSWPLGRVVKALPSDDGATRTVEIRVFKEGKFVVYTRPVTEVVLLIDV